MSKNRITVEGRTYPTISAACIAYGIDKSTYYQRRNKIGLRGDEIFTTPLQKGLRLKAKVFVNGVGYRSLRHAARKHHISYSAVQCRIKRGWSIGDALTKPLIPIEDATGTRLPVGTERTNSNGYIQVKISRGESAKYPSLGGDNRNDRGKFWVLAHRLAMCRHLGRDLLPGEIVHHRNGDRSDNRVDNLELCCDRQPPGQRKNDKKHFYISWLRKHAPEVLRP